MIYSRELKRLKKDAHWFIDKVFPDKGLAYSFIRSETGKCHISEMNETELKLLIRRLKKKGIKNQRRKR